MRELLLIVLGLLAGSLSGLAGFGGGIIIVPALVYLFHFSQHQAQGTTLALLVLPIGILAAWAYYKAGHVDVRVALFITVGFVAGSFFGARLANSLPDESLQKIFGVLLLLMGFKMILGK